MARTKRTDPHRPGAIIPADYTFCVSYHLATSQDGFPIPALNVDVVTSISKVARDEGRAIFGCTGKCGVCGAVFVYGYVWMHTLTGALVHLGHNCADKYALMTDRSEFELEMGRRAAARASAIKAQETIERREAFLAAHPGLEAALATDHYIVKDIAARFNGQLSEKQVALVLKLYNEALNPKPAEVLATAPTGKVTLEGRIVSVKDYESDYGWQTKCTIKVETEAGVWLAWGTLPSSLNGLNSKGRRVRITATLKPGKDAHFALMSRPRGEFLDAAEVDAARAVGRAVFAMASATRFMEIIDESACARAAAVAG